MTLNCKRGDLAVIVDSGRNSDRFVECVLFDPTHYHPKNPFNNGCWYVKSPTGLKYHRPWWAFWRKEAGMVGWIPDHALRPIRDPGDDVEDSRDIKLGEAMRTHVSEGADA